MAEPAPPPPARTPAGRILPAGLHLLGLGLLAHLGFGVFRHAVDLDEFQFLHAGWLVAQGRRPYVDFWDDHGPLLHLLVSLFYRAGGSGDAEALFLHRALVFALLLVTAALVRRIARTLSPGDPLLPGLALALYAASPVLGHKGIEVRSDNLQQPLFALSLLLWLRAAQAGRPRAFAAAGLAVGAGFLVTQKAAMLGLAAGCMFAVWLARDPRSDLRAVAWYGLGALVGPALLALWQWSAGAWDAFVAYYVADSVGRSRYPLWQGLMGLRLEAPLASGLALFASLVVLLRAAQGRLPVLPACLFACGVALVLQHLLLLPVHFLHTLIPAAAPVALVTAWAFHSTFLGAGRAGMPLRRGALFAAVFAVAVFEVQARRYDGRALRGQLARAERVASLVPRGALLFDGGQLPVEYPRPLPAFSLALHVQAKLRAGAFPFDVQSELERRDVAWWRVDGRAAALERELGSYRAANFLPLDGDLWVAGQRLQPSPGGADLEIRVAGAYWWEATGQGALRIDGGAAPNPVWLSDGRHLAEWSGGGTLLLVAAPPERWTPTLRPAMPRRLD